MKRIKQFFFNILNEPYKPFMVCAILAVIGLLVLNNYQRTAAVAEIKDAAIPNRRMLNSRAQIQIILINATLEGRTLNASEIDRIKQLWHKAEYDQTDESAGVQKTN